MRRTIVKKPAQGIDLAWSATGAFLLWGHWFAPVAVTGCIMVLLRGPALYAGYFLLGWIASKLIASIREGR